MDFFDGQKKTFTYSTCCACFTSTKEIPDDESDTQETSAVFLERLCEHDVSLQVQDASTSKI